MFNTSIKSMVKRAMNKKIEIAERKLTEHKKLINDRCAQQIRSAEMDRDKSEYAMKEKLVAEIIGTN